MEYRKGKFTRGFLFMSEILGLFPVPIFLDEIIVPEEFKEYVKSIEYSEKTSGHVSKETYILDKPEFTGLKNSIMDKLFEYTNNVLNVNHENIHFEMQNSWIFKMEQGDHGVQHDHANSLISGVLYLNVDDDSGKIYFHKLHDNLFPPVIQIPFNEYNLFNSNSWFLSPKNNMLVLFPANISHSIGTQYSKTTRYSLAFNFFPKGTFGLGTPYGLDKLTIK